MDVIKRNTDYALRLMARLAWHDGGAAISARALAAAEGVSAQLASKLLQQLSAAGLVKSRMGKRGGFLLSRAAAEISLAEMISVIQGSISFSRCATHDHVCMHQQDCRICGELRILQRYVDQALADITLADLARSSVAAGGGEAGAMAVAHEPRVSDASEQVHGSAVGTAGKHNGTIHLT